MSCSSLCWRTPTRSCLWTICTRSQVSRTWWPRCFKNQWTISLVRIFLARFSCATQKLKYISNILTNTRILSEGNRTFMYILTAEIRFYIRKRGHGSGLLRVRRKVIQPKLTLIKEAHFGVSLRTTVFPTCIVFVHIQSSRLIVKSLWGYVCFFVFQEVDWDAMMGMTSRFYDQSTT